MRYFGLATDGSELHVSSRKETPVTKPSRFRLDGSNRSFRSPHHFSRRCHGSCKKNRSVSTEEGQIEGFGNILRVKAGSSRNVREYEECSWLNDSFELEPSNAFLGGIEDHDLHPSDSNKR